jgi:hypothetical protein
MHLGGGLLGHDAQIPDKREFKTRHAFPFAREFAYQNSNFSRFVFIGVHSWF